MAELAQYLKARRPETYGSYDDTALNERFSRALSDDNERPTALQTMRSIVPEWNDFSDDQLVSRFAPSRVPKATPVVTMPQQLQTIQRERQIDAGRNAYRSAMKNVGANEELAKDPVDPVPVPEHVKESAQSFRTEVPHPASVPPPDQTLPARLGIINDAREVDALLKKNPGWKVVRPSGLFGTQVLVVDDQGQEQAVLDADATFNYGKTPGRDLMPHLTGQGSELKQAIVSGVRGLMDADRAQKIAGGMSEAEANQFGDPSRTSSLGPAPKTQTSGYGWREFGGDAGEQAARQDPEGALRLAQAASIPTEAVMRGFGGIDEGEAWLFRKMAEANELARKGLRAAGADVAPEAETLRGMQKANEDEAAKYNRLAEQTAETREDLGNLVDPKDPLTKGRKQEVAELAGRYRGQTLGQVADAVTPTEGTVLGGKLWQGVPQSVKSGGGQGLRIIASEAGLDPAIAATQRGAKWVATGPLGQAVNDQAGASAARGSLKDGERIAPKDVLTGAKGIADMSATTAQNEMSRRAWEATSKVLEANGVKPGSKAAEALIREATDAWAQTGTRASASPVAQQIIDAWQPFHAEVFQAGKKLGVYGDNLSYNPLHKLYGQDPTKAATQLESLDARLAAEAGAPAWQGAGVSAQAAASVPGLRSMNAQQLAQARVVSQRTVEDVGELIKQRVLANGGTKQQALDAAARSQTIPFPQAVGEAFSDVLVAGRVPQKRAAGYLIEGTKAFRSTDPDSFTDVATLLKNPEFQSYSKLRTVSGNIRPEQAQSAALEDFLRKRDLVILSVDKNVLSSGVGKSVATEGGNVVRMGREFAELDGSVVPREYAQAMREAVLAPSERYSAGARRLAHGLDQVLGLTQMKNTVTRGALGFEWRNNLDDMAKHIMSEGGDPLTKTILTRDIPGADAELRRLVAEVTSAPLSSTGKFVTLGGQRYDIGELHRALVEYGKVGKGWSAEVAGEVARNPGAGKLLESVGVGDVNLGRAATAVNKVAIAPGEASARLADKAFRSMFNVGGAQPGAGYTANDLIRAMNMLSRIRRGVAPERAGRDMLRLFIDFNDKSALDHLGGIAIPFWKYYSSSLRGALEVAAQNPASLRRLNGAMRAFERWDQSVEGGAINPRFKPTSDVAGQAPMMQFGGQLGTLRLENPWTTVTSLTGALSGNEEQGVGRYTAPLINKTYALATGKDLVTGRSVLGLSDDRMKAGGTLPEQFYRTHQEAPQILSSSPKSQAAYLALQYAPLMSGRLISPDEDKLARITMGLGGSPASRAPEDDVGALQRAILAAMGPRISPLSPAREFSEKAKKFGDKIPPNRRQMEGQEARRGKAPPKP